MFGSILSAGANLLGGILGNKQKQEAGDANAALQREFAQNGIRWKVEDAKAAGIHPLFALGAQTMGASPSYVGDSDFASGLASAGSDIGRAIDAGRTHSERTASRLESLAVERGELENTLLRSQIAKLNQPGSPPARPTSLVQDNPLMREGGGEVAEPAQISSMGYTLTAPGRYSPTRSADYANRMDDDTIGNIAWGFANRLLPAFRLNMNPPPYVKLKKGERWGFNPITQEYFVQPSR